MGFDNTCNTGLVLGLGFTSNTHETTPPPPPDTLNHQIIKSKKNPTVVMAMSNINTSSFEPSLTLGLSGGDHHHHHHHHHQTSSNNYLAPLPKNIVESELCRQASPPNSAVSSFSNASVKRERDTTTGGSDQEVEIEIETERVSSQRLMMINDEDEDSINNTRKKLRLTKEQSALLEDSFKEHSTLNPKQKQALARQLNLRPRQVEVWFQNRRARTKLKQTEVDCEFLKKCCESLTDENRRLHKELQDLKALKVAQPFYMQIPAATLSMCPSCERIGGAAAATDGASNKTPYAMASKPHHFYNPFTNPSAAC